MKSFSIKIYGRVQGVSFRWQTQKKAKSLNLTGFVCNQSDGTVYVEAEGAEEMLMKFLEWCRKGPIWSKVEKVEVEGSTTKGYNAFEIK